MSSVLKNFLGTKKTIFIAISGKILFLNTKCTSLFGLE